MTVASRFQLAPGSRVGIRGWSDIAPGTVVDCSRSGRRVTVRLDRAELHPDWKPELIPGGFSAHCANQHEQKWLITEDPNGPTLDYSLRHDGQWWAVGQKQGSGSRLVEGWRKFYDFNF